MHSNSTECFNINITLARFSASSLMMVEDQTYGSDIYVYFNANFNVFVKLIKVNLLVSELYIRGQSKKMPNFFLNLLLYFELNQTCLLQSTPLYC